MLIETTAGCDDTLHSCTEAAAASGSQATVHQSPARFAPPQGSLLRPAHLTRESVNNADFRFNLYRFAVQQVWLVAPPLHGLDGGRNQFGRP